MERVAFVLKVRADKLEEYKRRHAAVWPDMLQALRETGWHNYSLSCARTGCSSATWRRWTSSGRGGGWPGVR